MRRLTALAAAGLAAAAVVIATGCGGDATAASEQAATGPVGLADTCTGTIAVMAPYGDRPGDDGSIMNWARVALDKFNTEHQTAFTILPEPVDTDPKAGAAAARAVAANRAVIGLVGPKTSGVTEAIGPILDKAGIAWVSPAATRTDLADGHLKGFHRVVPDDSVQGPAIADFIAGPLGGGPVVVVHNPEPYSQGLAESITSALGAKGITPTHQLVAPLRAGDYSRVIAQIPRGTHVVAIPFLDAGDASRFVRQLRATGRDPQIIGGDGVFVPSEFAEPGTYVSSYAPDLRETAAGGEIIRLYKAIFGDLSQFGGPAYAAMEAVADAALRTCADGTTTRAGVAKAIESTDLSSGLLGVPVRFTPGGNLVGGRFHVYRITGNDYTQVN